MKRVGKEVLTGELSYDDKSELNLSKVLILIRW